MADQIYIGDFGHGFTTNPLPFNIDNDAFPTMLNFYTWRKRAKRKRGTIFLGQLQIQVRSASSPNNWEVGAIGTLDGSGDFSGNLASIFSLSNVTFTSGTFSLSDGTNTYTEPASPDGTLVGAPGGTGTINYATGALTITGGAAGMDLTGDFSYFPTIPVMGLRNFQKAGGNALYPKLLAFDTTNAYEINDASTPYFYNVTFYKGTENPFVWSGQDYQQFWTTNYSSALWATNNKTGLHFVNGTYSSGSGTATITFNFKSGGVNFTTLIVGDKLWFNEWSTGGSTLDGLVGTVSDITGAAAGNYVVTFDSAETAAGTGIAQLLTNSISGQDGIKWFDGDPTNTDGYPNSTGKGWVNFAPPLTSTTVSINNNTSGLYYLVGALAIVNYKDRLLFFSPYIQTSSGSAIQLEDTVLWSWNGTPYYNSLVPTNQTSDTTAYYVDETGKGGYLSAGISQPIQTVTTNEDVLIVEFSRRKTRFVYTGNDISPFLFFNINTELGCISTFSGITLDRGGVSIGAQGITLTTQQSSERVDLAIPDSIFQIQNLNNGAERVNAIRDLYKEWIYFAYPVNTSSWTYPTRTLLWNYRDDSWALFNENFTAHGTYRKSSNYTWATLPFETWAQWREAWNSGAYSALFDSIIGGNPEGYVLIKGQGTGEGVSGSIISIATDGGNSQITSYNHCVELGDYIYVSNCLGTTDINGEIGKVITIADADTFTIDVAFPSGTYLGLGQITKLSQPLIQTKQFPFYWNQGRQVRLSAQKYLLDTTAASQCTVNIYLSQDPNQAYNPSDNDALVYSQLMYTCPESTNIGLTAANTNLQMPTAEGQFQIWHRFNTSLIGDTFQVGITLSDAQMRNLTYATSEVTLHAMVLVVDKGPHLA